MVNEGSNAYLVCQASGNPLTTTTVTWRREGLVLDERSVHSSDLGVAFLTIKEVNRNDTGAFECVADNGIGGQSIHKTWLAVRCEYRFLIFCCYCWMPDLFTHDNDMLICYFADKPVMDDSPQLMKAACEEGQRAKLSCRAQGAPNISFEWLREGVPITSGGRLSFGTRQVDIVTWESTLEVTNVRLLDYGQYDCIARNEMGANELKVFLSDTSRPDSPIALRVLNVTHDSVDLTWESGFDGGLPQAYRIRYRQVRNQQ
jgi:hypothetical protein